MFVWVAVDTCMHRQVAEKDEMNRGHWPAGGNEKRQPVVCPTRYLGTQSANVLPH